MITDLDIVLDWVRILIPREPYSEIRKTQFYEQPRILPNIPSLADVTLSEFVCLPRKQVIKRVTRAHGAQHTQNCLQAPLRTLHVILFVQSSKGGLVSIALRNLVLHRMTSELYNNFDIPVSWVLGSKNWHGHATLPYRYFGSLFLGTPCPQQRA